jgi:hypothetical protein
MRKPETFRRTNMRTIVLALSLIALAAPSLAAPRARSKVNDAASMEKRCHELVGKEQYDGEGRSHVGQLQAQRFSDCMTGY